MDAYAQKTSLIKNHHFLHPVLILLVVFTCYTNTKMDDNEARTIDEQKTFFLSAEDSFFIEEIITCPLSFFCMGLSPFL